MSNESISHSQFAMITDTINKGRLFLFAPRLPNTGHYGEDVAAVLKKVWLESGCPCLPYFKAESIRWVDEYSTQVAHIEPSIREKILAMSDRTMSRMLSGETRIKPD